MEYKRGMVALWAFSGIHKCICCFKNFGWGIHEHTCRIQQVFKHKITTYGEHRQSSYMSVSVMESHLYRNFEKIGWGFDSGYKSTASITLTGEKNIYKLIYSIKLSYFASTISCVVNTKNFSWNVGIWEFRHYVFWNFCNCSSTDSFTD